MLERLDARPASACSGLESDGADRFYCGGGAGGKVAGPSAAPDGAAPARQSLAAAGRRAATTPFATRHLFRDGRSLDSQRSARGGGAARRVRSRGRRRTRMCGVEPQGWCLGVPREACVVMRHRVRCNAPRYAAIWRTGSPSSPAGSRSRRSPSPRHALPCITATSSAPRARGARASRASAACARNSPSAYGTLRSARGCRTRSALLAVAAAG